MAAAMPLVIAIMQLPISAAMIAVRDELRATRAQPRGCRNVQYANRAPWAKPMGAPANGRRVGILSRFVLIKEAE